MKPSIVCELLNISQEELSIMERSLNNGEYKIIYEDAHLEIILYNIDNKVYRGINKYSDVKNRINTYVNILKKTS